MNVKRMEELKQDLQDTVLNAYIKAEKLWDREFELPKIVWDKISGRKLGMAHQLTNRLFFRTDLFYHNPDKYLEDTTPHEVAHLITHKLFPYAKSHGREWKSVARCLGVVNPKSTSSGFQDVITTTRKSKWYDYKCVCGQCLKLSQTRVNKLKRKTRVYWCTKCETTIDTKRLFESINN